MTEPFDVAIIGGGINGCGCAADAALRGLSVVLCEKTDLASQTSSSSSKLIHGGLRYLEQFDFSLVRKALNERQVLLNNAPHLVHPLRFILPQLTNQRPPWLLRLGLFLYDHLSQKNKLPRSHGITRHDNANYFEPLISSINQGFMYYDGMTNDARLTITNALQAKQHGADIRPHTEVIRAEIIDSIWHITTRERHQETKLIKARSLINATGPWVNPINDLLGIPNQHTLSLIKGSHIVTEKLYDGSHAYILQNDDKRIIFTIPYFGHTLIGTTDVPVQGKIETLKITPEEIDYLCNLIARYFGKKDLKNRIITSWCGVRPLLSDPGKNASNLSRDYLYHFSTTPAPCVAIYGGKITTYRLLAKAVVDQLQNIFPHLRNSNTQLTPLPGATLDSISLNDYQHTFQQTYPWLDETLRNYYLQTYGTLTEKILNGCKHINDLGQHFGSTLYQREVDYLIAEEWAFSAEDILWRRTSLGLSFKVEEQKHLEDYISLQENRATTIRECSSFNCSTP